MGHPRIDLSGKTFGKLTVISFSHDEIRQYKTGISRYYYWECICECGNKRIITSHSLKAADYNPHCGCLTKERLHKRHITHGMSKSPEYSAWHGMIQRCYKKSPKYKYHSGRGIIVCDRWLQSFDNFLKDMGPRPSKQHSIDRINNDGNYEPSNCRWATDLEQTNNTRANVNLTYNGTTMSASKWSRQMGINYSTLQARIRCNWTIEKALTFPVKKNTQNKGLDNLKTV